MTIGPLIDARVYAGPANLSGQTNKVEFSAEAEELDKTVFEPANIPDRGWKERASGLLDSKIMVGGHWFAGDDGQVDDAMFNGLRTRMPWTIVPQSLLGVATVGDTALLTQALNSKYTLLGDIGKLAPFEASAAGSWPVARGALAHPPGTARTATGDGTAVQLGAVPAGQYLYASLHVLSIAGTSTPTITVKIQSDDAAGMASPTDRITFTAATTLANGHQIQRLAGPLTDTHYRASWTITGTTPSFLFLVAFGIATS